MILKKLLNRNNYFHFCLLLSLLNIFLNNIFSTNFNKFFLLVGVMLFIFELIREKKITLNKEQFYLIMVIVMQLLLIILESNYRVSNLSQLAYLSVYFVIFERTEFDNNFIKRFNNIFIIFSFVTIMISILLFVFGVSFYFYNSSGVTIYIGRFNNEATGIFGNSNDFGFITMLNIMVSCINYTLYMKEKNKLYDKLIIINIIVSFIGLLLCKSRGALLCTLCFFVISTVLVKLCKKCFFHHHNILKYFRCLFVVSLIILVSSIFLFSASYKNYSTNNSINTDIDQDVSTGRTVLWSYAGYLIKENPMLGIGFGAVSNEMKRLDQKNVFWSVNSISVHNSYYEIAVASGLMGLFIVLYYLYKRISNSLINLKSNNISYVYILSLIISLLLLGMFDSSLIFPFYFVSLIFWIYLNFLKAKIYCNSTFDLTEKN